MPADDSVDLLMKFEMLEGGLVPAESTDALGWKGWIKDPLLFDFQADATFEVFNFNFGAGVEIPGMSGAGKRKDLQKQLAAIRGLDPRHLASLASALSGHGQAQEQPEEGVRKWSYSDPRKLPVEMQSVSFSRSIDKASSMLLDRCFKSLYFRNVTLVKRRSTGGALAGYTYLRMDFGGVMLTKIDWSNDDEVQENITLVARSVQIQYRPVLPNGTLGAPISAEYKTPSRAAGPAA